MSGNKGTYLSNGQVLQSPPFSVRITHFFENIYLFLGLYFVSLFSLDPYSAAQNSKFNVTQQGNKSSTRSRWGGSGSGSGYGGGPGGGGGGGGSGPRGRGLWPKRVGRVDDIRGPECGSCG